MIAIKESIKSIIKFIEEHYDIRTLDVVKDNLERLIELMNEEEEYDDW